MRSKNKNSYVAWIILLVVAIISTLSAVYIVDQRQMAIILQFGNIVGVKKDPGLKFHVPFIQDVMYFDNRIQNISFRANDANEVVTADQKTMKLEAFAKYRLEDPIKFYKAVQNEFAFKQRLASIFESTIREVVGTSSFRDILGAKRETAMLKINEMVAKEVKDFGVSVIDMRITRIGLPEKARMSVYQRMKTDRTKEASEIRAQGKQEAEIIKAQVEREKVVMLADATKNADIIKGQGDSESAKIWSDAVNNDREFYDYYRSLGAYDKIFNGRSIVVDLDKMTLFQNIRGNNITQYEK